MRFELEMKLKRSFVEAEDKVFFDFESAYTCRQLCLGRHDWRRPAEQLVRLPLDPFNFNGLEQDSLDLQDGFRVGVRGGGQCGVHCNAQRAVIRHGLTRIAGVLTGQVELAVNVADLYRADDA